MKTRNSNPSKWTETSVLTVRPPCKSGDEKVKHPFIHNLAIRFQNKRNADGTFTAGKGVYTHYWSLNGVPKRERIGDVGPLTLKDAEEQNARFTAGMTGTEPVVPAVLRAKAMAGLSVSVGGAITEYLTHLTALVGTGELTAEYVGNVTRHLKVRLSNLHSFPIKQLERPAVQHELDGIRDEFGAGPADAALSALTAFFAWAIGKKGYCEHSPVLYMDRLPKVTRTNVPQVDELGAIYKAGKKLAVATGRASTARRYGAILQLLVLTAARRNQIAKLRWTEVFLDGSAYIKHPHIVLEGKLTKAEQQRFRKAGIVIGESRSKNRRKFAIILSRQAVALLRKLEPKDGEPKPLFVFPNAWGKPDSAFQSWGQADRLVREYVGEKTWIHHDFRRSFETLGQDDLDIPFEVLDASINHVPKNKQGTQASYNLAKLADKRLDAAQKWADYVEAAAREQDAPKLKLVA